MKKFEQHVSDPIPDDLLIDIFSRVPAKSIARFRCLSKFWASILGGPYFTKLFLTRSSTYPRLLFTFQDNGKLYFYSSPQPQNLDDDDYSTSLVATKYHTFFPKFLPSTECYLVNSWIGLYSGLQGKGRYQGVIFNPITGESIPLPTVEDKTKYTRSYLVFDPIYKQFKLLCMTLESNDDIDEHRILTLETGKQRVWRTIKCKPHCPSSHRICINGVLYYRAESDASTMVCFDVRSEKFSFINKGPNGTLINYKGKLGVIHYRLNMLELVVLEDAGKHEWTTKRTCILPPLWKSKTNNASRFVGMTSTGEIVLSPNHISDPFYVFYFNPEKSTFRRVSIQGLEEFKNRRVRLFPDYIEDVKLMKSV